MHAGLKAVALVVVLAVAAVLLLWPEPSEPPVVEEEPPAMAERAGNPPDDSPQVVDFTLSRKARERLLWNRVKRICPWPPLGDSWLVLDPECVTAMNHLAASWWPAVPAVPRPMVEASEALANPVANHAAVAAALKDHRCLVQVGETRPELSETCAAEAMVRLAALHQLCGMAIMGPGRKFREAYVVETQQLDYRLDDAGIAANSQEDYYHRVELAYETSAGRFYLIRVCRDLPRGVLKPPAGLPGSLTESWGDKGRALYELAQRLGTERLLHYSNSPEPDYAKVIEKRTEEADSRDRYNDPDRQSPKE